MLELATHAGCPYCATVERRLESPGRHEVGARRRRRTEVVEASGQSGVPELVDPENGVEGTAESEAIVAYLDRAYG